MFGSTEAASGKQPAERLRAYFSDKQGDFTRRYSHSSQRVEARREEDRRTVAELAYFQTDSRDVIAIRGRTLKDAQVLGHSTFAIASHQCEAVQRLGELLTNVDEFCQSEDELPIPTTQIQ